MQLFNKANEHMILSPSKWGIFLITSSRLTETYICCEKLLVEYSWIFKKWLGFKINNSSN